MTSAVPLPNIAVAFTTAHNCQGIVLLALTDCVKMFAEAHRHKLTRGWWHEPKQIVKQSPLR